MAPNAATRLLIATSGAPTLNASHRYGPEPVQPENGRGTPCSHSRTLSALVRGGSEDVRRGALERASGAHGVRVPCNRVQTCRPLRPAAPQRAPRSHRHHSGVTTVSARFPRVRNAVPPMQWHRSPNRDRSASALPLKRWTQWGPPTLPTAPPNARWVMAPIDIPWPRIEKTTTP